MSVHSQDLGAAQFSPSKTILQGGFTMLSSYSHPPAADRTSFSSGRKYASSPLPGAERSPSRSNSTQSVASDRFMMDMMETRVISNGNLTQANGYAAKPERKSAPVRVPDGSLLGVHNETSYEPSKPTPALTANGNNNAKPVRYPSGSFSNRSPSSTENTLQPPTNGTLQPPPVATRDVASPSPARLTPSSPTRRRGSLNLVRRTTRSMNSDLHLEDIPHDEDALRWAEHIRQKRASRRQMKTEEEDDDRVVVGTRVDKNHSNYIMMYNMLTGIRFCVSRCNAKIDRELGPKDFTNRNKISFDITGNELTPSSKYDFKFKDYAPWVFRRLRTIFRIDPADYLMSLTAKYILTELGSPGKSGSFFYFSRDYKYIIKTIHRAEHKCLLRILPEYYAHVKENPNTLLSQFYGLHRVKMPYGRKIHFVVMNNLFPPHRDIHTTFDLKGSTIGRDFKEENLEEHPRAVLKDLNWLRRDSHLEFGPNKKKVFIETLQRDVKLLQKLGIMDYSLLVGIHDLKRGNEEKIREKMLQVFQPGGESNDDSTSLAGYATNQTQANALIRTPSRLETARKARELRQTLKNQKPMPMGQTSDRMPDEAVENRRSFYFYSDDGGFQATHENNAPSDEIYYLGVIDCLTHYNFIKRAEHFFKGLRNPESQISAVPPDRYAERFIHFISGITKTREEIEAEKQNPQPSAELHDLTAEELAIVQDPRFSGINMHATKTDDVMDKAEKQAERSRQQGKTEETVPDRSLTTIRGTSLERGTGEPVTATLPVVEEVGESGSIGAKSSNHGDSNDKSVHTFDSAYVKQQHPAYLTAANAQMNGQA